MCGDESHQLGLSAFFFPLGTKRPAEGSCLGVPARYVTDSCAQPITHTKEIPPVKNVQFSHSNEEVNPTHCTWKHSERPRKCSVLLGSLDRSLAVHWGLFSTNSNFFYIEVNKIFLFICIFPEFNLILRGISMILLSVLALWTKTINTDISLSIQQSTYKEAHSSSKSCRATPQRHSP